MNIIFLSNLITWQQILLSKTTISAINDFCRKITSPLLLFPAGLWIKSERSDSRNISVSFSVESQDFLFIRFFDTILNHEFFLYSDYKITKIIDYKIYKILDLNFVAPKLQFSLNEFKISKEALSFWSSRLKLLLFYQPWILFLCRITGNRYYWITIAAIKIPFRIN